MSWFGSLADTVAKATESVTSAIPIDKELIAKLTLNTDEMKAERANFGEEATRKAAAKDLLSKMLPWETRDKERDILVDECREAILLLSQSEETFFGPYEMPELDVVVPGEGKEEDKEAIVDSDDEEKKKKKYLPSEESLEKLAKLEPLPPLLQEFDLDSHVGLIEMLFKEDKNLVERNSEVSGGGLRETTFWRNYFFHCAFTRYEAGLSIDEIWSFNPEEPSTQEASEAAEEEQISLKIDDDPEELVEFQGSDGIDMIPETAFISDESDINAEELSSNSPGDSQITPPDSVGKDFDFLDDGEHPVVGGADPELDALEAEILAELED